MFDDVFAGILVGGRGTRMGGVDKARLRRPDGRTYLEHLVGELRGRVVEIALSAREDQDYGPGLVHVADRVAGAGPMGGLDAMLARAPARWCFLVACDLPDFDVEVLERLVAARGAAPAVVATTDDGMHPTCALYERTLADEVRGRVDAGDLALYRLLEDVEATRVEVPVAALRNVNR